MKRWYHSKTLWVNIIFVVAAVVQNVFGFPVSIEMQSLALALANMFLRIITHEELTS